MKKNFLRLVSISIAAASLNSNAAASCGSANCPIDNYSGQKPDSGWVRVDLTGEYIDQDQPRIGRQKASVGEIPGHHDEVSTLSEVKRFTMDAGLTPRLVLSLSLPSVHREHQHVHNDVGGPELESWNFDGLGDLTGALRYDFYRPSNAAHPRLGAIVGGKFPTGKHNATNADGEVADPGIQPGSGAYSLILGASSVQVFSVPTTGGLYAEMPFFVSSTYQWNGTGDENYKLGNMWLANVGTTYPVLSRLGVMLQLNSRVVRKDDAGSTDEEIEKTGGSFIYISPGLEFILAQNLRSYMLVQLPVYQRVNGIQLTSSYNLFGGVSYRFKVN